MSRSDRWYEHICVACTRPFMARGHNAKYCPDCKAAGKKAAAGEVPHKNGGRQARKTMSLAECAAKAKELGMTYGEYVARGAC